MNIELPHIRQQMPRKGGSEFYLDKRDYSDYAKSLCGQPITSMDIDYRTAGTKKFQASGWPVCRACAEKRLNGVTVGSK